MPSKQTKSRILLKLKEITELDSTMNAEYFKVSYGIDVNEPPQDDLDVKYWLKCIKDMQGKTPNICSTPCSKEKRQLLSEQSLNRYACTDGTTLTTYDVAAVFNCHIGVAARKIKNVKKWTNKELVDRQYLDTIDAYNDIQLENSKSITTYTDIDTKKNYTIRDFRIMFPRYSDSVLKKTVAFLENKNVFSIEMLKTKLATKQQKVSI